MSDNSYMGKATWIMALLLVLASFSGCGGNPAWSIRVDGDIEETTGTYVFNGTVLRYGSADIPEDHVAEGVLVEFRNGSNETMKTIQVGDMISSYESRTLINATFDTPPQYVLVKYNEATVHSDAAKALGLRLTRTENGSLTYQTYYEYDAQYR